MSAQSVDLLIIGDGVSARAIQWQLQFRGFPGKVLQVYSPKLYPMTSLKSTGLVAYHGMKKGVSPLGDLLCTGVDYFFKNIMNTGIVGLEPGFLIDTCPVGDDRIKRRYGESKPLSDLEIGINLNDSSFEYYKEDAVFINPALFLDSLLNQYHYDSREGTLVGLRNNKATFLNGDIINFKKIVLATGVGLTDLTGLGIQDERKISEVAGSFYNWNLDLGKKSFALGLGSCNLVYRANDMTLMLGGTTQKNEVISHDGFELDNFYESALLIAGEWLPSKEDAQVFSGTRVKGPKRMPLFEEVVPDVFILGSAYKNGWSQSFYGASEIVKKLL